MGWASICHGRQMRVLVKCMNRLIGGWLGSQLITEYWHKRSPQDPSGRESCRRMAHDWRCNSQKSSFQSSCQQGLVLFQRCRCTRTVGSWELKQVHLACFCFPTTQPVPPAFAALRDGRAHAWAGIAVPGLEWHCHQLCCSWAGLGALGSCAVTDVFATTAEQAPAVLHWCLSHWGEKHKNNNTKAAGLQQGVESWEFLQPCVPGMEMSGKAADQQCWSSCGCREGAQQSAQAFVCSHADRWSVHSSKPAAFQWWLPGLNAAHSGLKWNSSSLLCWQAADDGSEHDTQFSPPAAYPGLCSGLARHLPSPYQKEEIKY